MHHYLHNFIFCQMPRLTLVLIIFWVTWIKLCQRWNNIAFIIIYVIFIISFHPFWLCRYKSHLNTYNIIYLSILFSYEYTNFKKEVPFFSCTNNISSKLKLKFVLFQLNLVSIWSIKILLLSNILIKIYNTFYY